MATLKNYKIVLAGSGGSGKTTFINKLMPGGKFCPKYIATLGVGVQSIDINENVVFNIWDTAGQEKFTGLGDGYYIGAHAAVIFYDLSSLTSYNERKAWVNKIRRVCGNIPIMVVGSKSDIEVLRAPKIRYTMSTKLDTFTERTSDGDVTTSLNGVFNILLEHIKASDEVTGSKTYGDVVIQRSGKSVSVDADVSTAVVTAVTVARPDEDSSNKKKRVRKTLNKKEIALMSIEKDLSDVQKDTYYKFREDMLNQLLVVQ